MSDRIRTYGNWRKPSSPGIGRLGLVGSALLIVGLGAVIIGMMVSATVALLLGLLFGLVVGPLLIQGRNGRNGLQWAATRASWIRGQAFGHHLYRSGPVGRLPTPTCRLPGILATEQVHNAYDAHSAPFALLSLPSTNHHTVVLSCKADGASLVDPDQVDSWVAHWGQWLASLAYEPRLVGASVTIETAPDTGERLRREVAAGIRADAPDLARQVLTEVVRAYPLGSAEITTRVALTYSGAGGRGLPTLDARGMAVDLGARLPGLARSLSMTGAGPAQPMTAAELADAVRIAYDPTAAALVEQATSLGAPALDLNEAGPIASEEAWGHYRHDGAYSITWAMVEAPRGEVFSNVLARLVTPAPDLLRKRLTLLYRPHDPATVARLVERDRKDALFRAQQSRIEQARDSVALRSADQTAVEEATGAGLVRFGLLLTATVTHPKQLSLAQAVVDNLSASARIRLRRVFGAQACAFAAALPLGLVLADHVWVPQALRNAM